MTVTYTTAANVGLLLSKTFSASSTPVQTTVERFINQAEDYIDFRTGHAWRTRYSKSSTGQDTASPEFEYQSYGAWIRDRGYPVYFDHRRITALVTATYGDQFQVLEGTAWNDWLATKTEGAAGDYEIDLGTGVIYLKTHPSSRRESKCIRLKYRYGESAVPFDIQEAADKLAAIKLLQGDDRSVLMTDAGVSNYESIGDLVRDFKEDIEKILSRRAEVRVCTSY